MKILTYSLDLALSKEYLEVIIESLEPMVFNEKVKILSYEIKDSNKTSTFTFNISSPRYCMMHVLNIQAKYMHDNNMRLLARIYCYSSSSSTNIRKLGQV